MLRKTSIILCAMMVVVISLFTYYHVRAASTCVEPDPDCCNTEIGYGGYGGYGGFDFSAVRPFPVDQINGGNPKFQWKVQNVNSGNPYGAENLTVYITIPACVAGVCNNGDCNIIDIGLPDGSVDDSWQLITDEGGDTQIKWELDQVDEGESRILELELDSEVLYSIGTTNVELQGQDGSSDNCTITGLACPETGIPIGQIGKPSFREIPVGGNQKLCFNLATDPEEVSFTDQGSVCPGTPIESEPITALEISAELPPGTLPGVTQTGFESVFNVTDESILQVSNNSCFPFFYNGRYYNICN